MVSVKNVNKKGIEMGLHELEIGKEASIFKIIAVEPFKSRLFSLGLNSGEKVRVLAHTLAKNTFEIEVNNAKIALRVEEAQMIKVKK